MRMISRSSTALGWTAWRGLGTYGALRQAQGRLSARRYRRSRAALLAAGGTGLAVGLVAGFGVRSLLGGGCAHNHDHDRQHDHEHADLPAASADRQAEHAADGALAV
jgi:hypothetical protein